jgi:hypothetical protein
MSREAIVDSSAGGLDGLLYLFPCHWRTTAPALLGEPQTRIVEAVEVREY